MSFRVGDDLVAQCGKCKLKTMHVIFALAGNQVERIQCKVCLSYRKPKKSDLEEEAALAAEASERVEAPPAEKAEKAEKKAPRKAASSRPAAGEGARPRRSRKEVVPDWAAQWDQSLHGKDLNALVDYRPSGHFLEGTVLNHASFGVGCVTRVTPDRKMEVLFRDGVKMLVCNRS